MPALNVPPAPVSTSTRTSLRASRSSTAAAIPRATAPLMAFRASGRLIVMTATPSVTSVRTGSAIASPRRVAGAAWVGWRYFGWNRIPPSNRIVSAFM